MPKHVLITGASGFIGSHLCEHLLVNTNWKITGIDGLTYAGDVGKLVDSTHYDPTRVRIFWHDLRAPIMDSLDMRIRARGEIDYIINVASASHIDNSIADPVPFVQNNVNIVLHMLEYARKVKPEKFVQFETDEIYGSSTTPLPEWSVINPSNPYSASKAAQGCLAIAWWRTYGVPAVLVAPMNNFGERQDREKFVPKCIHKIAKGEEVTLHGTPTEIGSRYYLHARNASDAVLFLLQHDVVLDYPTFDRPARFNIVGDRRVNNLDMAMSIAVVLGKELNFRFDNNPRSRPGHDLHYALDGSKLAALGWKAPVDFEQSLRKTVEWTLKHPEW